MAVGYKRQGILGDAPHTFHFFSYDTQAVGTKMIIVDVDFNPAVVTDKLPGVVDMSMAGKTGGWIYEFQDGIQTCFYRLQIVHTNNLDAIRKDAI
jgi:hypothetical protein